jgi:hypothetical protein
MHCDYGRTFWSLDYKVLWAILREIIQNTIIDKIFYNTMIFKILKSNKSNENL